MPRPQGDFRQKRNRQLPRAQTDEYLNSKVLSVSEMKLQFSNAESSLHWHNTTNLLPSSLTESTHHDVPEVSSHSTIPALSAHLHPGDTVKRPPQQRKRAEAPGSARFFFLSLYASSYTTLCRYTWEPVFSNAESGTRYKQRQIQSKGLVRITHYWRCNACLNPTTYIFPTAFTTWSYTSTKNK